MELNVTRKSTKTCGRDQLKLKPPLFIHPHVISNQYAVLLHKTKTGKLKKMNFMYTLKNKECHKNFFQHRTIQHKVL